MKYQIEQQNSGTVFNLIPMLNEQYENHETYLTKQNKNTIYYRKHKTQWVPGSRVRLQRLWRKVRKMKAQSSINAIILMQGDLSNDPVFPACPVCNQLSGPPSVSCYCHCRLCRSVSQQAWYTVSCSSSSR